jgi:HD-GYP domain-containing protein (c-di-GMP phosphodiesterase class II)
MALSSTDVAASIETQRLTADQLRVRAPLPFDIYDGRGKLLMRRGQMIATESQLERLVAQGIYLEMSDKDEDVHPREGYLPNYKGKKVSVFTMISDIQESLDRLLRKPPKSGFATSVIALARLLQRACRVDADAALAHTLLAGDDANCAKHSAHAAIFVELLLTQIGRDADARASAIAAAFTMNMTVIDLQERLSRQTTKLSPEQQTERLMHPYAAASRLRDLNVVDPLWLAVVEQHHEAYDGSGYPRRLAGEAILQDAQILMIADCYCAMVSKRAYRSAAQPSIALKELFLAQGKNIQPKLAALLVKEIGIYPPGSFVTLANGEIAVVVKRSLNAKHPIVKSLISQVGLRFPDPIKRITSDVKYTIEKTIAPQSIGFALSSAQLWEDAFEIDATANVPAGAQVPGKAE